MLQKLEIEQQTATEVGTESIVLVRFIESRIRSAAPCLTSSVVKIKDDWLLLNGRTDSAIACQMIEDAAMQCVKDYCLAGLKSQIQISR